MAGTSTSCLRTPATDTQLVLKTKKYQTWPRRQWHPTPVLLPGKSHGQRAWWAAVHGIAKSWTRLSDFPFTFHFHALEKEMASHSSVLAWRIPGTKEPDGSLSMGFMVTLGKRSVPFYDTRLEVLGTVYFCPNVIQKLRKDHLIPLLNSVSPYFMTHLGDKASIEWLLPSPQMSLSKRLIELHQMNFCHFPPSFSAPDMPRFCWLSDSSYRTIATLQACKKDMNTAPCRGCLSICFVVYVQN